MTQRRWGPMSRALFFILLLSLAPVATAAGQAFWESEAARMTSLGASINETWYAMAMSFFFSQEYANFKRNDNDFVTDLYQTFFNRAPDPGGLAFWNGQIAAGMPREVVLAGFMFSPEFVGFTQALFGNTTARAEVNVAVDFYRGTLSRLPDTGGFNFWVEEFRHAQCQGGQAVYDRVQTISSAFLSSPEYAARARTNAQYVGDLYNAILRRGGDLPGVQFWIHELDSGALTRDQVRQGFVASPEFNQRVVALLSQGCGGAPINILPLAAPSSTALTPLRVVAAGIDSVQPVTVSFSNSAGYAASIAAIRASADGTVVVPTPLYVDPATHQVTSGTVNMKFTQGAVTSSPVSLTIQALPTVASYGVAPGAISHALLAAQAVAIASRIDELQTYQIASNGRVDTSATRAALNNKLIAVVEARNDIDRIILNSSVSIANGNLSNGTPVTFNSTSLDMMDRTAAVFLMQVYGDSSLYKSDGTPAKTTSTMSQIIDLITHGVEVGQTGADALDGLRSAQSAWKSCRGTGTAVGCVDDSIGALAGGLSAVEPVLDLVMKEGSHLPDLLGQFGAVASAISFSGEVVNYWTLRGTEGEVEPPDLLEGYAVALGLAEAFIPAVAALPFAPVGIVAITATIYKEMKDHVEEQDRAAMEALANAAIQSAMIKGRVAEAKGKASIANSQGIAAAQTGLELCGFGSSLYCIDTLADTAGNYGFTVPMGVPNTNYSTMSLYAYDPVTNDTLGSAVVDLRGLNTNAPVSMTTVTGSCVDTDATSPDGDDPDCD